MSSEQVDLDISQKSKSSPLDIEGVDLDLTKEEIVEFIREGRKYS